MGRWLTLLAGPLIWAAHFAAIYAISSIAAISPSVSPWLTRGGIVLASIIAAIACVWIVLRSLRADVDEPIDQFWRAIVGLGAVIALFGIVWETLPIFAF